jgi:putative SOS response-associated peptidase YedK
MPVILPSGAHASWLSPAMRDSRTALGWLVPYPGEMRRYPVSTKVSLVQNDDAECAKPVESDAPPQRQLFT